MPELQASLAKKWKLIFPRSFCGNAFCQNLFTRNSCLTGLTTFREPHLNSQKESLVPTQSFRYFQSCEVETFPFLHMSIKSDKHFWTGQSEPGTNYMQGTGKWRAQVISLLLISQFRARRENQSMRNRILFAKDWQLSNNKQINNKQITNLVSSKPRVSCSPESFLSLNVGTTRNLRSIGPMEYSFGINKCSC